MELANPAATVILFPSSAEECYIDVPHSRQKSPFSLPLLNIQSLKERQTLLMERPSSLSLLKYHTGDFMTFADKECKNTNALLCILRTACSLPKADDYDFM
jgi:hypothetical protein